MTAKKTETKKTAPKMTKKEQANVKEQLGALIAGTSAAAKGEAKPKKAPESKPSTVESPVALVHATCDKMKGAPRKDVLAALVAKGVNKYTAATQYQKWRTQTK